MGSSMSLEKPAALDRVFARAETATAHKRPTTDDDVSLATPPTKRRRLSAEEDTAVIKDILTIGGISTARKRGAPDDNDEIEDRPPKCARTESQEELCEDYDTEEKEKRCRITELPQELQLSIMKLLEPEDLFLLQRTCRTFFHMSFDRAFSQYFEEKIFQFSYPTWRTSFWKPVLDQDKVAPLIQADRFCQTCRQARSTGLVNKKRKRLLEKVIYCSGCRKRHPELLFSSIQRAAPWWKRRCIGREGHIQLCVHQTLSWEKIEELRGLGGKSHTIKCNYCENQNIFQLRHPALRSRVIYNNEGTVLPVTSWQTPEYIHISTEFPVFRYEADREIDLEGLKSIWRHHSKHLWLKRITCPHIDLESDQLLAPFGAAGCACLGATPGHRERHEDRPYCCACQGEAEPGRVDKLMPRFNTSHLYCCNCCKASYSWHREDDWVCLTVDRSISLGNGPASERWLAQIVPESYSITDDMSTRHVTWCVDESCATRERWTAVGRLLRDMASKERVMELMGRYQGN